MIDDMTQMHDATSPLAERQKLHQRMRHIDDWLKVDSSSGAGGLAVLVIAGGCGR